MKRLVLEIYPVTSLYKGARVDLLHIAKEVSLHNGMFRFPDSEQLDGFIERLFKQIPTWKLTKLDDATYEFGYIKANNQYVPYGRIIKVNIL